MQLTFRMGYTASPITPQEFTEFETLIGKTLPQDYRQHMLTYNGGVVLELNNAHISNPEGSGGVSDFYPIKYGSFTMEQVNQQLNSIIPSDYIKIGRTQGGGKIIMSLNNDSTYGNIKEWYPDDTINDLSPSFTQLLNDQVEQIEY